VTRPKQALVDLGDRFLAIFGPKAMIFSVLFDRVRYDICRVVPYFPHFISCLMHRGRPINGQYARMNIETDAHAQLPRAGEHFWLPSSRWHSI
jgi:hypothetical protein